jgi:hypothetical protein
MRSVGISEDFVRIRNLPIRTKPPTGTELLTEVLKTPEGSQILRPVQAQALAEIYCCRGLLGPIRVGAGKTLISFLAPRMVNAQRPILLVPAKLREKTHRDFHELREHWVPGVIPEVISYESLGRLNQANLLEQLRPDLIIADEVHNLKNPKAAVTRRVGRYMVNNPHFVGLSGTITKRSLMDFAHLAEWALENNAPVPLNLYELEQWAIALDEDSVWGMRIDPGALLDLFPEGVTAREKFQKRLENTPGVVAASGKGCDASIRITPWTPRKSPEIQEALKHLWNFWELPDETPLVSAVEVWRHAMELSQGFYYKWKDPAPEEWLEARKQWSAIVRHKLSYSRLLDSAAQVEDAHKDHPAYIRWLEVRDTFRPQSIAHWITKDTIKAAAHWAAQEVGIIWVGHRAVGKALQDLGVTYYGNRGVNRSGWPIEDAKGSIAASIAANSEGRNLQQYNNNLILCPPTTGDRWEQLIGRTHREGQKADQIQVNVLMNTLQTKAAFEQAISDAKYQKQLTGQEQKLLLADKGQENEYTRKISTEISM